MDLKQCCCLFEPFSCVVFNFCEVAVVIGMLIISPGGHSEGFRADAPCTVSRALFLGGGGDPGLCVPINNWESLPHVKLHHSLTVCTSYFQNVLKRLRRYHD